MTFSILPSAFATDVPHIHCEFTETVRFVTSYLCIIHLLIICLLIFQFSLLCCRLSLHPFLLPRLKRFTSPLSPCRGTLPHRSTQFLSRPLYSFISFSFIYLFFIYSLCLATSHTFMLRAPSVRPPAPGPRLFRVKLNAVNVSWFNSADLKKADLEKGDKLYQICSSSPLVGSVCIFTPLPTPCSTHPVCALFPSPFFSCFFPLRLLLRQTLSQP